MTISDLLTVVHVPASIVVIIIIRYHRHHHLLDFVFSYPMSKLLFAHAAQARVPEVSPTTTSVSNNLDPIPSLITLL